MDTRPNILLVMVDDMGVHQLGCYGSTFYETPHLDQLARGGARFSTAYSASPVCSPARAALYTGLHPARLHLTNYIPGTVPLNPRLITPAWRPYLPVEIDTLGDVLKRVGYATGHFGKWHLAPDYHYYPGRPMDPESQGFDEVVVTRKPPADSNPESDPHHIHGLTRDAVRFVQQPRSQPFFCVLAHNALHRPEFAPAAVMKKFAGKPGADLDHHRPVIAAMVSEIDRSIGTLMAGLNAASGNRETIVVFTSDHGAFGRSSDRKPLRGAKADLYEGGVRVPLIFHSTRSIAAGDRDAPAFGADLFPTLLAFAGEKLPPVLDGVSLRDQLIDLAAPAPARGALYWHYPHYHHLGLAPSGAIRAGKFKLIEWFDRSIGGATDGPPFELFDLEADPGETRNLAELVPGMCSDLAGKLRAWRRDVGAQEMTRNPQFDPTRGDSEASPPPGDPGNPYRK